MGLQCSKCKVIALRETEPVHCAATECPLRHLAQTALLRLAVEIEVSLRRMLAEIDEIWRRG